MITLKRIYEPYSKSDGFRILVDRLWPRGVSKDKTKINLWIKDIGPSNELRKWFGHKVERWMEFKKKYKQELKGKKDILEELEALHKKTQKINLALWR